MNSTMQRLCALPNRFRCCHLSTVSALSICSGLPAELFTKLFKNLFDFFWRFGILALMRDMGMAETSMAIVFRKWVHFNKFAPVLHLALGLTIILSCGCTSIALRNNTLIQGTTVGDLLADQVLFNLILFHDYYTKTNSEFSGIPSFVKIATGTAQSQHGYTATVAGKVPTIIENAEEDPSIAGTFQNQDSWGLVPITEPSELQRLFNLYSTQFTPYKNEDINRLFPVAPAMDAQGRPLVAYTPRTNADGSIIMTPDNTNPTFTARVIQPKPITTNDIPGCGTNSQWFTFDPDVAASHPGAILVRKCLTEFRYEKLWILDRAQFFKFTMMALGGTNTMISGGRGPAVPLHISNGFLLQ